ncbi:MAG: RNase adapter RapZ [Shimia sp.]
MQAPHPAPTDLPYGDLPGQRLVIVTGPSGAGRSTAINALEDLGFEAIDNLPLSMLPRLVGGPGAGREMVVGIGTSNRDFSAAAMIEIVDVLSQAPGIGLEVLYLDCDPDVLVTRYSATRRRHPQAPDETPLEGIRREIDLLAPIHARADFLIDTTELSPHDLRAEVAAVLMPGGVGQPLAITLHSFSYKRGLPRGIDMAFDCRFLRNPHWEAALRPLTGRDPAVQAHVRGDARFAPFQAQLLALLETVLPAHMEEGKAHLSIAFGCTGGQHRSVTLAETTAAALAERGWRVSIRHRELERRGDAGDRRGAQGATGPGNEGNAVDVRPTASARGTP